MGSQPAPVGTHHYSQFEFEIRVIVRFRPGALFGAETHPAEQRVIAVLGAGISTALCDAIALQSLRRAGLIKGSRLTPKAEQLRKAASNTRRCICGPTKASARRATRSVGISISTIAADRIKALTTPHRIKPTSTSRHSAWRPNPGRRSTYQRGESVQTTGTSSAHSHRESV